ncbi:MAG: DUF3352 domain-containing protein [Bacteroidota bacterium]|nr:DUF3352 domain-containing protein [Bacteroidota bacterium]
MAVSRKIILYGILSIVLLGILGGGFYYYQKFSRHASNPFNAIPSNTAIFFELQDPLQTFAQLENENELWMSLKGIPQFRSFTADLNAMDTLMKHHEGMQDLFGKQKFYISFHQQGESQTEVLYLFQLDPPLVESSVDKFIMDLYGNKCHSNEITHHEARIEQVIDESRVIFSYTIYKGLFIGSHAESLVRTSIDQLDSEHSIINPAFEKVKKTAGKNVDANIYIQHHFFNALVQQVCGAGYHESISLLANLGLWSETDLILKKDELLLNGYTNAIDSLQQFLSLFSQQKPQAIEITRILPYHTKFILSLGVSSFDKYYSRYLDYLKDNEQLELHQELLSSFNRQLNTDVINTISSWIGHEIATVIAGHDQAGSSPHTFTLIHAKDREKAWDVMDAYSTGDPLHYKDYLIKKIAGDHSIPAFFGRGFQAASQHFFVHIDDYVVFAENPSALEQFINIYFSGKTLKRNENYKNFADNLSDKSNIFIYLNIRNSNDLVKKYLSSSLADLVSKNTEVFSNFEGLAAQFSFNNGMFYTNIYAKYNPAFIQEDLSIWKVILDSDIQGQPHFVKDHRTNTLKIVVFDKEHQMYLIDHNGKIVWKIPIGEEVISSVYPVDFYKNGKIQYLFNTESNIYLIDLLGRPVAGYPIKLSPKASNGLSVFDYEGRRNYRILLAREDNRIYNLDINGLPIRGWKKPMAKDVITRPVEHVRMQNKDYLLTVDTKGQVMILNRKGVPRINLKEDYTQAANTIFYPNRTNSTKGIILTTDQDGKLTYIKTNGKIDKTDFGSFSPEHHFLYEDFDNNGHKDFIFLDRSELIVYDRFKEIILQHTFKDEIGSSPVIIPVSENKNIIGIVSDETRRIYLFDNEGNLVSTPDMIGKTQILVGSVLNDGQLNLIVGSGNTLFNYYFQ